MSIPAVPLRDCILNLTDAAWPFERERATDIETHWREAVAEKPAMWDGRVLLMLDWTFEDGLLTGAFADVAYSSYHAWKTWNFPDRSVVNCFGSAMILSSDGALLYGVMAASTSNGGKIFPVAGMLDHNDVGPGGAIDIFASIGRELEEETGIPVSECRRGDRFALRDGQLLSIAEILHFDETAEALARRIRAMIAADPDPELEDVVIIRRASDLDKERSLGFAHGIAEHILG